MGRRRLAALLAAPIAAAVLAACGDAGGDKAEKEPYQVVASTTMTVAKPPLTRSQFVNRINEICREAWPTVTDNFEVYSGTLDPTLSRRNRFREAVRLSILAGIDFHIFDNFRVLGSPKGEEEEIEQIIGPFQAAVELGQKNRWRAFSVAEIPPHFVVFNRRARQYGLDDCLVNEAHMRKIQLGS